MTVAAFHTPNVLFGHQRRVGRHVVQDAQFGRLADLFQIGRISDEFHFDRFYISIKIRELHIGCIGQYPFLHCGNSLRHCQYPKRSVGGFTATCSFSGYLGWRHISGAALRTFAVIGIPHSTKFEQQSSVPLLRIPQNPVCWALLQKSDISIIGKTICAEIENEMYKKNRFLRRAQQVSKRKLSTD